MTDTICALSTARGSGAIAVIRLSGNEAIAIAGRVFRPHRENLNLSEARSHTAYLGLFETGTETLDEVLLTLFRAPHSYTGNDLIEISCHGSQYIQQRILETLLQAGARMAKPGEFTLQAFLNQKMDLSQAEAVADLIAAHSKASHNLAMKQMRGGFSKYIQQLRTQLIELTSLLELELDFSEEDVEFADRMRLNSLIANLKTELTKLANSFQLGNVLRKGIPVAIVGKPNVGKSTLLNAILKEERAIVSDIPGTTRDTIEDSISIDGILFRFIDTAGLRSDTTDTIETIGIQRTHEKIREAQIVFYVFDSSSISPEEIEELLALYDRYGENGDKRFVLIGNKVDQMVEPPQHIKELIELETIFISAKRNENINLITEYLSKTAVADANFEQEIVTNARHYEAITQTLEALQNVENGFAAGLPSDIILIDLRQALYHLGSITGQISNDEILDHIFGNFCIGK